MGKRPAKSVGRDDLGKALIMNRMSKATLGGEQRGEHRDKWVHNSELREKEMTKRVMDLNLRSVTEQDSLEDFLNTAELAGTDFESERLNLNFAQPSYCAGVLTKDEQKKMKELQTANVDMLRIPRRPEWKGTNLNAHALQAQERESFLQWRRNLALAQEQLSLSMTPYEKNLEFWRQLWRVIEKSDVIVQIVDARNPLLFYCADLENYVKEVDTNKINLVLVNKSDFLSQRQRLAWLRYFESKKVRAVFWSAAIVCTENETGMADDDASETTTDSELGYDDEEEEEEESDDDDDQNNKSLVMNKFGVLGDEKSDEEESDEEEEKKEKVVNKDQDDEEDDVTDSAEETEEDEEVEDEKPGTPTNEDNNEEEIPKLEDVNNNDVNKEEKEKQQAAEDLNCTDEEKEKCKVLNGVELIELFKSVHAHCPDKAKAGTTTIGLVGYPNVGKSSTINALIETKKVAVSETPGKTKHYQTIVLDDELLLCDCPGLVFPSFVSTRGELIVNGILPVDQMRDYNEPTNLVTQHIPKSVMEMIYGMTLPKPKEDQTVDYVPSPDTLCSTHATFRGYMNHKGMPDVNRSARFILKDYVNGKLLYCYPPPGLDGKLFQDHRYEISKEIKYMEKLKKIQKRTENGGKKQTDFDKKFFDTLEPKALVKGSIVGYHRNKNQFVQHGTEAGFTSANAGAHAKPSKKHHNINRKDKLRRKTTHFDRTD